jgi:hypothetical protein
MHFKKVLSLLATYNISTSYGLILFAMNALIFSGGGSGRQKGSWMIFSKYSCPDIMASSTFKELPI